MHNYCKEYRPCLTAINTQSHTDRKIRYTKKTATQHKNIKQNNNCQIYSSKQHDIIYISKPNKNTKKIQ